MNKTTLRLENIKLVGISVRTSNAKEMNPSTAQIGLTMQKFFQHSMQERILNRKHPGRVFAVYTNYESDENGDYTYFLGEEVVDFKEVSQDFETLTIPSQKYIRFTSEPGPMPFVCIDLWKKIWKMGSEDLGGQRGFLADFELYDERSCDLEHAILDIYIGV